MIQWYPLRAPSVAGVAEPGSVPGFVASAIFPSRVIADFSVTSGLPSRMYLAKLSFSFLASASNKPTCNADSCRAELRKSLTRYSRIRIFHGADHAADSGRDHGIGARPGAALMRARLQIQVESSAARRIARLLQCENFGVLHAVIGVRGRANFAARRVHHNRAHRRIRRHQPNARSRQLQRPPHVLFVGHE